MKTTPYAKWSGDFEAPEDTLTDAPDQDAVDEKESREIEAAIDRSRGDD